MCLILKIFNQEQFLFKWKNISKELLDKITQITSLGNIIGEVYKTENNIGKCVGYNIEGKFETSKEISDIVNFFQGLIHFLEMEDFIDECDDYYILVDDNDNINNHQESLITNSEIKNDVKYPDNYNGIPIDYPNILFWYVDINLDLGWKNILANYKDLNGEKINLFDYVVVERQDFLK